ncbi:ABC transporter permease [Frankia sp. ACN1ag]|uniref:ABC transporter permease n=1 Tax=Frankia sp. ACN1ag TaxID=102891 RepID=UPI0009F87255|nr:ABC transporter permease subunit [Frankia sp. ACN1ag]
MTDAALSTAAAATVAGPATGATPTGDPAGPDPLGLPPRRQAAGVAARDRLRRGVLALVALVLLCAVWEGYKAVGSPQGTRLWGAPVLPRTTDAAMPHVWSVLAELGRPELSLRDDRTVGESVLRGMWFSLRVALAGFGVGVGVGVLLAVAMARLRVLERGLLPYVIASQTIPLVALAPLVAGWGGRLHLGGLDWQRWMSVALIAAYLAFFPVAVGMLRGLQAPAAESVELMRSYAASWWQTLIRLRLPASVPYLMPALRLAAASAVIGTVVAEISTGTRGGVGRLIIDYSMSASSDATRLYDAVLGAAAIGLVMAAAVALLEAAVGRRWGRHA